LPSRCYDFSDLRASLNTSFFGACLFTFFLSSPFPPSSERGFPGNLRSSLRTQRQRPCESHPHRRFVNVILRPAAIRLPSFRHAQMVDARAQKAKSFHLKLFLGLLPDRLLRAESPLELSRRLEVR